MASYRLIILIFLLFAGLAGIGIMRLDIETDVVRSLPAGEHGLSERLARFRHHPLSDQVAVDITRAEPDAELLAAAGDYLEERLHRSGLFERVGVDSLGTRLLELERYSATNLPILFSASELEREVAPLLAPERLRSRLARLYSQLSTLDGIGQARLIADDPLGLRELVVARMAPLRPAGDYRIYRGHLLSGDGTHLLVTAKPKRSSTDTEVAAGIGELIEQAAGELNERHRGRGNSVTFTPVGAFRAALDNERIIRRDVRLALGLATFGIVLLLLVSFPRPLIGLLALLPALAGTAAALFVYSLFHSTISLMVLGFGGALISITVDHGISYLLFLDRPRETTGKEASREVRAIGIMAVITSVGAFTILSFSPFPLFTELGRFTALGIFFSFLFVHSVMPRLIPVLPPGPGRRLPLQRFVAILCVPRRRLTGALLLGAAVLMFWAQPRFEVDLGSMNTVTEATREADRRFTERWGGPADRIYLMTEAETEETLQRYNDRVLAQVEDDVAAGTLQSAFVPAMLFPGPQRQRENLADWRTFWDDRRIAELKTELQLLGAEFGFAADAFGPFLSRLETSDYEPPDPAIPPRYFELLGITRLPGGGVLQFGSAVPGDNYEPASFSGGYGDAAMVFDPAFFGERIAGVLFSTFTSMLAIIAVSLCVLLVLFYLDITLTLLTLLPVTCAYVCTLGVLRLIGRPLDIPALMLSVVILGMGIDYSVFFVRAHQRYRDRNHQTYRLAACGIFLAAASTLIGFGSLWFARHAMLQSIGIVSSLGIFFACAGTFLLLPPLLTSYFNRIEAAVKNREGSQTERVLARYRGLEAYPRLFARIKLRRDPMFADLDRVLRGSGPVSTIFDIGCGFGLPACWLLERWPGARVFGIDPDYEKVRVASLAVGGDGRIVRGFAPSLPKVERMADLVLLLDMLHYLDDDTVRLLLAAAVEAMRPGGLIAVRVVRPLTGRPSAAWRFEHYRIVLSGKRPRYRSLDQLSRFMKEAGFAVEIHETTAGNPELAWLVSRKPADEAGTAG